MEFTTATWRPHARRMLNAEALILILPAAIAAGSCRSHGAVSIAADAGPDAPTENVVRDAVVVLGDTNSDPAGAAGDSAIEKPDASRDTTGPAGDSAIESRATGNDLAGDLAAADAPGARDVGRDSADDVTPNDAPAVAHDTGRDSAADAAANDSAFSGVDVGSDAGNRPPCTCTLNAKCQSGSFTKGYCETISMGGVPREIYFVRYSDDCFAYEEKGGDTSVTVYYRKDGSFVAETWVNVPSGQLYWPADPGTGACGEPCGTVESSRDFVCRSNGLQ